VTHTNSTRLQVCIEEARWAEYRGFNVRACAIVLSKILENQETFGSHPETMLNKILRPDKRFERTPYSSTPPSQMPYQMLIRFLGAVGKVYSMLHREAPHEVVLASNLQQRHSFINTLQRHLEAIRKQVSFDTTSLF
jgi:hypothetical protein